LGQIPPNRKYDIALGPHSKVKFFVHMWTARKYLRIAAKDVGKKTQDSNVNFIRSFIIFYYCHPKFLLVLT